MRFCPKCNFETEDVMKFCPNCGSELIKANTNDVVKKKNTPMVICLVGLIILGIIIVFLVILNVRNTINEMTNSSNEPYDINTTAYITTTTVSRVDYIAKCQTYKYKDIARNPENFEGLYAKFTGKVVQTMYDGSDVTLRVNVTKGDYGYWDDTMYVRYSLAKGESKILEDDIIDMYGVLTGEQSYESIFGQTITIPRMNAAIIDIK